MLKAYAAYFIAYLLSNLKSINNIGRIVLYGSAAKGGATKDSDIDIFIEVKEKTAKFNKELSKIEKRFYESRDAALFKPRGIENKFSIKTGKLEDWKELYRSIASTGIILYGPYEAKELPSGVRHSIIIFWQGIGKNRGAFLNKLYGFKIKGKHYLGMLPKLGGKKIGKSCVMFPVEYREDIFRLLKKHEVAAKIIDVFS